MDYSCEGRLAQSSKPLLFSAQEVSKCLSSMPYSAPYCAAVEAYLFFFPYNLFKIYVAYFFLRKNLLGFEHEEILISSNNCLQTYHVEAFLFLRPYFKTSNKFLLLQMSCFIFEDSFLFFLKN